MENVTIEQVVDLLNLRRRPNAKAQNTDSIWVRCPFCDDTGYHMNVNLKVGVYHCVRCMSDTEKGTGTLDLYARIRLGERAVRGVNTQQIYRALLEELGQRKDLSSANYLNRRTTDYVDIPPAPDANLHAVYKVLLELPELALSNQHRKNLHNRGLSDRMIAEECYRTLPESETYLQRVTLHRQQIDTWYQNALRSKEQLPDATESELKAGRLIAMQLMDKGAVPKQVPGFFKIQGAWVFRYQPGMIIPTRNWDGQIVGLQIRRDTLSQKGLRYMTVSSKGLDKGVTRDIARTHISRGGDVTANTTVILTEGPLKADVIRHLSRAYGMTDTAVIAVQGVNNTKRLPPILARVKSAGVKRVYLALDMDKLCNPHVLEAEKNIQNMIKAAGLSCKSLCWDANYAQEKARQLDALAEKNKIQVPSKAGETVFDHITGVSRVLREHQISFNTKTVNGRTVKDNWKSDTKGLDDYLCMLRAFRRPQAVRQWKNIREAASPPP